MKLVWVTFSMTILLMAIFAIGQPGTSLVAHAESSERDDHCRVETLPQTIQSRLKEEFVSWRVQRSLDLSPSARKRWESEKPAQCPGIAVGRFESAKAPSYALLLVTHDHADAGYRLLVFSPKAGQSSYEIRVLDTGESGAPNFFIRRVPMSKFFDHESRKKFRAYTSEGILLVDAAEQEYEVDVYFWAESTYQHQSIDY